jgi:hypothetical protein
MAELDTLWPFKAATYDTPRGPIQTYAMSVDDRVAEVKRMTDRTTLEAVLNISDLQKSVLAAARRRMRQLGFV